MGCAGEIEKKGFSDNFRIIFGQFSDKTISRKNKKDARMRGRIIG